MTGIEREQVCLKNVETYSSSSWESSSFFFRQCLVNKSLMDLYEIFMYVSLRAHTIIFHKFKMKFNIRKCSLMKKCDNVNFLTSNSNKNLEQCFSVVQVTTALHKTAAG